MEARDKEKMERHRIGHAHGAVDIDGFPCISCRMDCMQIFRCSCGEFICVIRFVSLGMTLYAAVTKDMDVYIRRSLISVARLTGCGINLLLKEFKA